MIFMLGLWPAILARKAFQARELIVKSFDYYFRQGGHLEGSALIQHRYNHNRDHGIPPMDIAGYEVGGAFAVLGNTTPATFWTVFHIFSNPLVLEDCRAELMNIVKEQNGDLVLDITQVKASCPILLSTFKEVLRFHGTGVSAREVMEDHMLDKKYFLKKGSVLMIPSAVQHSDPTIWGPDVGEFKHRRFLRSKNGTHPNPVAFRGFGGGTVLCPGRHFATTEILTFAALMVLQFDVRPMGGKWVRPKTNNAPATAAMPVPDTDIHIEIRCRDYPKVKTVISGSEKVMEIAAEDILQSAPKD